MAIAIVIELSKGWKDCGISRIDIVTIFQELWETETDSFPTTNTSDNLAEELTWD